MSGTIIKINSAMNGKSNDLQSCRELGSLAVSPGGVGIVKVRPGAHGFLK